MQEPCQKYKKYEKKYLKQNESLSCWELENNQAIRGPSAPVLSAAMQYRLILLLILCTAQIWIRLINQLMLGIKIIVDFIFQLKTWNQIPQI